MGEPVKFEGSNHSFGPPPGLEEMVGHLPVFANGRSVVTAWKLDPEELAEIMRTGMVFCTMMTGMNAYPMYVGSEETVRQVCSDTGPTW